MSEELFKNKFINALVCILLSPFAFAIGIILAVIMAVVMILYVPFILLVAVWNPERVDEVLF